MRCDYISLSDKTWPSLEKHGTVVVPVGAVEQHGPHLPLDTDTVIATALAKRVANAVTGILAPPICYGASGEHQQFIGTVSIGTKALIILLIEMARSLTTWASRVIFVNGHGGNSAALKRATELLTAEGRNVEWVPCYVPSSDAHAGRTETSLMLFLDPERVRLELAQPGNTQPLSQLMPALLSKGVSSVSENGVLGDPTGAHAGEGEALFRQMVWCAMSRLGCTTNEEDVCRVRL
ncbi:mycofactocin biosynthesis peptidyl-dipeptidase MftE [Burkholderia sp. Ax-1719]|nr:mycofactocin biosynthesis peptidyl-dipeptidase MftE [Burkholderia sp. Ax-1719]